MKKTLAVLMAVAMVGAAFAGPVEAKKKKKKKKKPKPPVCQTFAPGELGAEAETLVVTDEATEEAPAIFEFSLAEEVSEGIGPALGLYETPTATVNVQVDTGATDAGLYATFEFPDRRDYDLWAYYVTGEEAASSHGFNPLIETQGQPAPADQSNTATNHAGETTAGSENIVGLITNDCDGYTFQAHNYLGEGGDFELKLWLGEGQNEPKPIEGG